MTNRKIAIVGTGYVGLPNGLLLAQHNEVVALDIITEKVEMLNEKISPIEDKEIDVYRQRTDLNLKAALDKLKAPIQMQTLSSSLRLLIMTLKQTTSAQNLYSDLMNSINDEGNKLT